MIELKAESRLNTEADWTDLLEITPNAQLTNIIQRFFLVRLSNFDKRKLYLHSIGWWVSPIVLIDWSCSIDICELAKNAITVYMRNLHTYAYIKCVYIQGGRKQSFSQIVFDNF